MRKVLLLISLLISPITWANEYYALVVGVSDYPNLDDGLSLQGPKFDAVRVKNMLLQQGFSEENIHLLADGVMGAQLPNKEAIVNGIYDIEQQVEPGDFVYLHFSGHGSQQPIKGKGDGSDAVDGLDEIFLPRDVQQWSRSRGEVPNSLTDDEVKILTTRLRNKGANVWSIFDSCHSGTMTRSITGQQVRTRNIDLGILANSEVSDVSLVDSSSAEPLKPLELIEGAGTLISFGAAQSNEEAPEMELPSGDTTEPQGLFTYTMTSMISQNPNISYRQLAQGILTAYNSMPWYRTTPLFEGQALDEPIFHRDREVDIRYPISKKKNRYLIQAGQLNGFEAGAVVAAYDNVSSETAVAVLEITASQLATSEAVVRSGEMSGKKGFVKLQSPAYPPALKVKWQSVPGSKWQEAVGSLLADNEFLERTIEWVDVGQPADLSLYVSDNDLYFFTLSNAQLPCQLSVLKVENCDDSGERYLSLELAQLTPKEALNNSLTRLVRANNLKRLATQMVGNSSLVSEVFVNDSQSALDKVIKTRDGDELYMSFANQSRKPIDLTVMFIDSGQGITQIYPELGHSGRLFAGEFAEFGGEVSNENTTGEEQFVVIAVPVSRDSPQVSLAHLQQAPLDSTVFTKSSGVSTRAVADEQGYELMFAQALGDMPQQRAFKKAQKPAGKATISVIRLKTE